MENNTTNQEIQIKEVLDPTKYQFKIYRINIIEDKIKVFYYRRHESQTALVTKGSKRYDWGSWVNISGQLLKLKPLQTKWLYITKYNVSLAEV